MKKTVILAFCLLLFLSGCQVADKTTTTAAPETTASSAVTTTTRGPVSATAPPTRKTTTADNTPPEKDWWYCLKDENVREDEVLDVTEITIDRLLSMDEGLPFDIYGAVKCGRAAYICSQGEENYIILIYSVSKYDPDKEGFEKYGKTGASWNDFIEYYETEEITSGFFSGQPVGVKKALRNIYNDGYNVEGTVNGNLGYIDEYYGYMYGAEKAAELWQEGEGVCLTYSRPFEEETQMFFIPYIGVPEEDLKYCLVDDLAKDFHSLLAFRGYEKSFYDPQVRVSRDDPIGAKIWEIYEKRGLEKWLEE